MPLLEVTNLVTRLDTKFGRVDVVDDVTLDLDAGETVGLVGESGSGKTLTALSLMRLVPHPPGRVVGGQVRLDGRETRGLDDEEFRHISGNDMAMVFQDPMTTLNPLLRIGTQICESIEEHLGLKHSEARQRSIDLLKLVGIPGPEKRLHAYPHEFSGGMRQRISIAMALACEPKLLIADEVTTALDVTIQSQVLELLQDLSRKMGMSVLLITHDLGIVAGMTQRVNVMYAGQIVEQADTGELFENPMMPYTWGLLGSLPRLDRKRSDVLVPIEGRPPEPGSLPPGCRFEPALSVPTGHLPREETGADQYRHIAPAYDSLLGNAERTRWRVAHRGWIATSTEPNRLRGKSATRRGAGQRRQPISPG